MGPYLPILSNGNLADKDSNVSGSCILTPSPLNPFLGECGVAEKIFMDYQTNGIQDLLLCSCLRKAITE
jgi:hypothetical protein